MGTVAESSSLPPACQFDVDVLLGNWMRDGGRTHVVQLIGGAGGGHELSAIEFWPAGGSSGKPIVRTGGRWSLNGYVLDEGGSMEDVLKWRHTASGSVRTWWRPTSKAPAHEGPLAPPPPSTSLMAASEAVAN